MFPMFQFTTEIARQRHTEMLRCAERHHRLFRRPVLVEPVRAATAGQAVTAHDAPVIAMPARASVRQSEARVA